MNKESFSFDLEDTLTPDDVVRKALKQIEDATDNYVVGHIEKYIGEIYSYKKRSALSAVALLQDREITVDIQEQLGEQAKEKNRYEVFLTVKGLEHYKYRIMFIDYGTISYPVTIVMNESLAQTYSGKKTYIFTVEKMKDLEDMINVVINSDVMITLLQSLINEALRKERQTIV